MCTVSTREEYDRALLQCKARHGLVVVDFFAPWCSGCRRLYPKLRQIAAANLDVAFIKVCTCTAHLPGFPMCSHCGSARHSLKLFLLPVRSMCKWQVEGARCECYPLIWVCLRAGQH